MNIANWLEVWYYSECNGDWEHSFGISIMATNNPGWCVTIDLDETVLEDKVFDTIKENSGEDDWILCWTKDNQFNATGDINKLEKILNVFKEWSESEGDAIILNDRLPNISIVNWLEKWYGSICDSTRECYRKIVLIETLDNPGWSLKFNINDTLYEDVMFVDVKIDRSDNDWVYCEKKDGNIECAGGPKNLEEMLGIIKKWTEDNAVSE